MTTSKLELRHLDEDFKLPVEMGGRVNPNLLHNWYFGNLVDRNNGYVVPPGVEDFGDAEFTESIGESLTYRNIVSRGTNSNGEKWVSYIGDANRTYYTRASNAVRGYSGKRFIYDGWENTGNGAVIISDVGISCVNKSFSQQLIDIPNEYLLGKTVTISVLTEHGLSYKTGTLPTELPSKTSTYININHENHTNARTRFGYEYGANKWYFHAIGEYEGGTTPIVIAAKLELGTEQTLAHQDENGNWVLNEIPDYAEQMAICQQYDKTTGAYLGLTPEAVGAVAVGKELTNEDLNTVLGEGFYFARNGHTCTSLPVDDNYFFGMQVIRIGFANNFCKQIVYKSNGSIYYRICNKDGLNNTDWTTHFLPLDGSVPMSSSLKVNSSGKSMSQVIEFDGASHFRNSNIEGNRYAELYFAYNFSDVMFNLYDNSGDTLVTSNKKLYGEHNKPSGSYTGNGSATKRTIDVGGLGRGLLISAINQPVVAILTPAGGFMRNDSSVSVITVSQSSYYNGVLAIAMSDKLNVNGETYHYQVL